MLNRIRKFFLKDSAGGLVMLAAALLAVIVANSPLLPHYEMLQSPKARLIVNEGLMSFFFLLIGIEIKYEVREGALSERGRIVLPVIGALGGVALPALIFTCFNYDTLLIRGWAIPTATDIAFALGMLSLFGARIPAGLRLFLMVVAVMDDLVAVLIIAVFYTHEIFYQSLGMAGGCAILMLMYTRRVKQLTPYLFAGAAMWLATLDSGVHATIAGVMLGLLLPVDLGKKLRRALHPAVTFGIVPLFIFANAGIAFSSLSPGDFAAPLTLGIAAGLFLGKQLGIFLAAWAVVKLGFSTLPGQATWRQFYAVCIVAGIGFTMSLFIGSLAFIDHVSLLSARLGVIAGSLASAIGGAIVMAFVFPAAEEDA